LSDFSRRAFLGAAVAAGITSRGKAAAFSAAKAKALRRKMLFT